MHKLFHPHLRYFRLQSVATSLKSLEILAHSTLYIADSRLIAMDGLTASSFISVFRIDDFNIATLESNI